MEGPIGDLSFYNSVYGPIVRRKGGAEKEQIRNWKSFERVRESNTEFACSSKCGSFLRQQLKRHLKGIKDHTMASRLMSVMQKIKDQDVLLPRGKRQPGNGLQSITGKNLLKGFDFNKQSKLSEVLKVKPVTDTINKQILLANFSPKHDLKIPAGASHANIKALLLKIDLNTYEAELAEGTDNVLPINTASTSLQMQVSAPIQNNGNELYLVKLEFFQEVSGQLYSLENGHFNCMTIVEIL
jgi:hypothetical protein